MKFMQATKANLKQTHDLDNDCLEQRIISILYIYVFSNYIIFAKCRAIYHKRHSIIK